MFTTGQRVLHTTTGQTATIVRVAEFGEVIIQRDNEPTGLTLNTRECFLRPLA